MLALHPDEDSRPGDAMTLLGIRVNEDETSA